MSEPCLTTLGACGFEKTLTFPIAIFEVVILLATLLLFFFFLKKVSQLHNHYWLLLAGVFIFEFFTAPMWDNLNLGQFAYVYHDVSWVLTVGWATLIGLVVLGVDYFLPRTREWKRFFIYLFILTPVVFLAEVLVVNLGIRGYAPEVLERVTWYIMNVPVQAIYYIPVFITLIITFYKYWSFVISEKLVVPQKSFGWVSGLLFTLLGVIMFELVVEPMVINRMFPEWSYIYYDISILMSGVWVLTILFVTRIVDRFLAHWNLRNRFFAYLSIAAIITVPIEAWLIEGGYRVYVASAVKNFVGFNIGGTNVPIEIAFAVPLYLCLVICFVRYWEIITSDKK